LLGADASHAWISVFVADVGWMHLCLTNNGIVNETSITLAWERDSGDVAPIKAIVSGCLHTLTVIVDITAQKENKNTT